MLEGVLPDLTIDRMWQQILVTVDSAPAGRFRRAVEWMRAQWPSASFAAVALRPRLIALALAFVLGLTIAIQQMDRPGDGGNANSVAASAVPSEAPTSAPNALSALQISGAARGLPLPRPEPASSDSGRPVPSSYNRGGGPGAGKHVPSPPHLAAAPETRRDPRDHVPWRSGCHPD
jgi:hypothetical protein